MKDLRENVIMPLFNCYCKNCHVLHEVIIPLDELNKEIPCPDCGEILERLISAPFFAVR